MFDFSTGKALGAMRRTAPFIAFRLIVYFGIGLAYAIGIGAGAGTGYLVTAFADEPGSGAGIGGMVGFGAISALLYWARGFKAALLEPFAIAALMQAYFKVIEGQQPNPEWDEKLSALSDGFRELKDKALAWTSSATTADKS